MKFDLDEYHDWRRKHPVRALPRDVEESLVAEVQRLRAVSVMHDRSVAAGEHRERTAIIEWLRGMHKYTQEHDGSDNAVSLTLARTAERIERGEHWRECWRGIEP